MELFPCALIRCLRQQPFDASVVDRFSILHLGKDAMAFFLPLRLGKQEIPILAPVNEWPKAIPGGDAKR